MKKEHKSVSLTVRVTPTVKQLAERLATADGRSVASLIERLILKAGADQQHSAPKAERPGKARA